MVSRRMGLSATVGHSCCTPYGSTFICLAVVAFQSCEITQNYVKIWPYSSSGSSKVIDLGVNRKPRYDFLLVINSNSGHICYRFRDVDAYSQKMADFTHPSLVW